MPVRGFHWKSKVNLEEEVNKYITVPVFAENDVNVMQLGDQISAFVDEGVLNSEYTIKQTNLLDHGWDESGKAYLITQFTVEFYAGVC